jgi:hypothetical protein
MSTDNEIEAEIQAKGLNAPRLTPALIEEAIADELYYNPGRMGSEDEQTDFRCMVGDLSFDAYRCLTICILVLKNGFTVVGKSACASPENFDRELGRKIAREDAKRQIWPLEGYLLKDKLAGGSQS